MHHMPTVLVVTADKTCSVSISPKLLYAVKPLLALLSAAVLLLSAGLGMLGWLYFSEYRQHAATVQQLQHQIADMKKVTSAQIEAKLAVLQQSEQMVLHLQQYLKARGVQVKPLFIAPPSGKPNDAAGGPVSPFNKPVVSFAADEAGSAPSILQAVEHTPLGLPHAGALTSAFGGRSNPFSGQGFEDHGGLDFKGNTGDPVWATASGKIVFAGRQGGYGAMVRIRHGNGYETVFAHLSKINVQVGDSVKSGDVVGLVGSTGRSTGPHLHYEIQRNGERVNPEHFLSLDALPNA